MPAHSSCRRGRSKGSFFLPVLPAFPPAISGTSSVLSGANQSHRQPLVCLEPRDEQRDGDRAFVAHGRVAHLQHVKLPEPLQNPHLSLIGCHDTSGEGAVHRACVLDTHGLSREEHVVHGDAQLLVQVTGFVRPHRTCRSQVCSRPSPVRQQ